MKLLIASHQIDCLFSQVILFY